MGLLRESSSQLLWILSIHEPRRCDNAPYQKQSRSHGPVTVTQAGPEVSPLSSFVGVSEGCYLESDGGSLDKLGYIEAPVSSGRTLLRRGLGTHHTCVFPLFAGTGC